jgi:hypothetical protein
MDIKNVIGKLAQPGWLICTHDLGGFDGSEYWLEKREGERVTGHDIRVLMREGWLESFNGGYRLSDAGRAAYMRSTDELGDGKLLAPSREGSR